MLLYVILLVTSYILSRFINNLTYTQLRYMEIENLISIVPTKRQLELQQMEFYSFLHFGINTFANSEWGKGTEDPQIFNLQTFNAKQIVSTIKAAGMKGIIITAKHHDGFCLWKTKYTTHSVEFSPYKNDIVKELADECSKQNIKLGIYLSPWDRNNPMYGHGVAYDDYFVRQLTELLTNYGEIFCVWFDGACGEGTNGKKQTYDWERYYKIIRKFQPNACINVCGPDVRWCGNEAGITRESEWSVVPKTLQDNEKIHSDSQNIDNNEFRERLLKSEDMDLGSRERLKGINELIWYPAEVDVSIRPGWFYHESENESVKSFEKLKQLYYSSVGGNATLLLNIPPTTEGTIHSNDTRVLLQLGKFIKDSFTINYIKNANVVSESKSKIHDITNIKEDDYNQFFIAKHEKSDILIELPKKELINHIVVKENINMSQRIEKFTVTIFDDDGIIWDYNGTIVGYKRIIPVPNIQTNRIEISILESRSNPTISFLGIY